MKKFLVTALLLFCSSVNASEGPKRIVAVGGALTEILFALGEDARIVGTDTTSYYPEAAASLPKVGYQRNLSAEGILSLQPDLLLVNEDAGPPPVLAQLENAGLTIVKLISSKSILDIKENITVLGNMLGREDKALQLVRTMDATLDQLQKQVKEKGHKPSVLFIMNHGNSAPMVAGRSTSANSIITMAGGRNVAVEYGGYKPLTPEAAVDYSPEFILVPSRSYQMIGGEKGMLKLPGIGLTPAGKKGQIIHMDGLLLLGFGPRTANAAVALHKKLQADK